MSAIDAIKGIFKTVAPVAANLVLPGAGSALSAVMNTVLFKKDPGLALNEMSDEEKAELIRQDPELILKLRQEALNFEATIAKEQTKNMTDVNETMKAELTSGRWYQRAWRPWCGFMFPVVLILNYIVVPIYLAPKFVVVPTIPWEAIVAYAGVLGVAAHGRNKEKQAAAGIAGKGLLNTIGGFLKR